jgi:hypothetical protein
MAVWGKIAYSSWTIVILLVFVLTITAFIFYNINKSNFNDEKNCSAKTTKDYLNTTYKFVLGLLIACVVLIVIALILAIISSVKAVQLKNVDPIKAGLKEVFGTTSDEKISSKTMDLLKQYQQLLKNK